MRLIVLTTAATLIATSAYAQDRCAHEAQRSATLDAASIRNLEVDAGAGFLKVIGKPGLTSVRMSGRACASSADLLDDIKLEARRDGDAIVVKANVRDTDRNFYRNNAYARLDLTIEVPAGLNADIDDGSGDIELSHLGAVHLDDGSGDIVADDLASADIDDGSGEIRLIDIRGDVDIEDGSGEIELRNVAGMVDIEDGSGEISIRRVEKSVRISDASGSIDVSDVGGDFIVSDDGSGSIDYADVRGRVDIPRKKR